MCKFKWQYFFILLFFPGTVAAQDTVVFSQGLVVGSMGEGNRSAIYTDPILYGLVSGQFVSPNDTDSAGIDRHGKVQKWEKIRADSNGVFQDRKLRRGYLFLRHDAPRVEIFNMEVSGHAEIYVNGVPRGGDVYNKHWVVHPVKMVKGINTFLVKGSRGQVSIRLVPVRKPVSFTTVDMTIPDLISTETNKEFAAIRIVNNTGRMLHGLRMVAEVNGITTESTVPVIMPMTTRKVPYSIANAVTKKGVADVRLRLHDGRKIVDETNVQIEVKDPADKHKRTFISDIDGSVQYYAVVPGQISQGSKPAMFLSLHGAGVEARGQAGAYAPKDWGHVICPTNRREFGFDWEDWGRWDALEVEELARKKFGTDPVRTYLTGHSMGGHGTWQLGVLFPDKWAAIAPIAGWYSFFSYGGKEAMEPSTPIQEKFVRASNASHTLAMSGNYTQHGIYIQHGDMDDNVPVEQARHMREHLGTFHTDFAYLEYPGKRHWFGVDHQTIFDYFKWHSIAESGEVEQFEFTTPSPGISSRNRFVTLYQQDRAFDFSGVSVRQTVLSNKEKRLEPNEILAKRYIRIETDNLRVFQLDLQHCEGADTISIEVDGKLFADLSPFGGKEIWFGKQDSTWQHIARPEDPLQKNPARYGNFKDAFRHRMVFVYSTRGTGEENTWSFNKARFDAETFYYRGNGSVDVIPDTDFELVKYKDRSVILYGNATTNGAWRLLLNHCPVQAERGAVRVGDTLRTGQGYGLYFIYPRSDSDIACVGVIGGTGMEGFRSAMPNRYFVSGVGIPDLMLFTSDMYREGFSGVTAAGYFGVDWRVESGDFSWQ